MRQLSSSEAITVARRRFFDGGVAPHGLVPENILASWRRCAESGLDAAARPVLMPMERHALSERQERHEELRRLCRPELESLYASANQAGSIVILTAADGLILDALGDAEFLTKAARVALKPGVPWSEAATGTNAIGTAIVERRAVEVRGQEHFYRPHGMLSCSASPIFDPRGAVVGVLDLSGEASIRHLHALGMVQLAVEQIEYRLFERQFPGAEIVRFQHDPELLGTPREGMVVFENHKLVAANRQALRLLGLDWNELGRTRYDDLFASALPRPGDTVGMRCQTGELLHARREASTRVSVPVRQPRAKPARNAVSVFAPEIAQAIERHVRLLDADIPTLLQGETGTGKERVARELHRRSARATGPFVAVNCAALPEGLIEAELFGYQAGAFTGARKEGAAGLLRDADGGVLFLDELGDMPLTLQSRFLRVLQEREVTPLGGGRPCAVDIAVIAATHQDLTLAVAAGTFRADLYYRIAQATMCLPALRDHASVIATIRAMWLAIDGDEAGVRLSDDLVEHMASLPWPGNLRQLVGVLRSMMVMADAGRVLGIVDLPAELRAPVQSRPAAVPTEGRLDIIEQQAIDQAIAQCRGNVAAAARRLGISRSTIYRKLER
ncbi:transcriptional regulator of acetoin/glycerol metabolism [Luteibacter jiangsuensis]|uniref:Transcriptional regulator of acetoin/glycerol metabolism n=1 Tax=Luteibacter jiangsuensis TaxID=637577 RepID=A0ABT9SYR8_9GAMM|nr:sigma-54-dependent Fis family transcriptional regulator [Luteibacter jiangsuensis]MDQ0009546.1 transcriptional regulator of acetoin/glycerol metabolism [Luteibacter jiangsuensis]